MERQVEGCGEGAERRCIGQFRDESFRVNVQLLLFDSGAEIEIEAALKALLDELVVEWNVPHLIKGSRNEVERTIFFIELLPLLEFFLAQQIFLGRIVGLVVSWQFLASGGDVDDPAICHCATGPGIKEFFLLLLIFFGVPLDSASE